MSGAAKNAMATAEPGTKEIDVDTDIDNLVPLCPSCHRVATWNTKKDIALKELTNEVEKYRDRWGPAPEMIKEGKDRSYRGDVPEFRHPAQRVPQSIPDTGLTKKLYGSTPGMGTHAPEGGTSTTVHPNPHERLERQQIHNLEFFNDHVLPRLRNMVPARSRQHAEEEDNTYMSYAQLIDLAPEYPKRERGILTNQLVDRSNKKDLDKAFEKFNTDLKTLWQIPGAYTSGRKKDLLVLPNGWADLINGVRDHIGPGATNDQLEKTIMHQIRFQNAFSHWGPWRSSWEDKKTKTKRMIKSLDEYWRWQNLFFSKARPTGKKDASPEPDTPVDKLVWKERNEEGRIVPVRSDALVKAALNNQVTTGEENFCTACNFTYRKAYGFKLQVPGGGFEVHHIHGFAKGTEGMEWDDNNEKMVLVTVDDVAVVCPMCHTIAHDKGNVPIPFDDLVEKAKKFKNKWLTNTESFTSFYDKQLLIESAEYDCLQVMQKEGAELVKSREEIIYKGTSYQFKGLYPETSDDHLVASLIWYDTSTYNEDIPLKDNLTSNNKFINMQVKYRHDPRVHIDFYDQGAHQVHAPE